MEIKVIEDKKNKLVFEITGVSHGFCNVLKKELWNNSHVKSATYKVDHPLVGVPTFRVETDGKENTKAVLLKAAEKLSKKGSDLKKKVAKAL